MKKYIFLILVIFNLDLSAQKFLPNENEVVVSYIVTDFNKIPETDAKIIITKQNGEKVEGVSDNNGKFKCLLPKGDKCKVLVRKFHQVFNFESEIPNSETVKEMDQSLQITVTKNYMREYKLEGVNFEKDKDTYGESSYLALYELLKFVKGNPDVRIEIAAYVYTQGDKQKNLILSQKRAKAIANYLSMNQADEKKFHSKGYGEAEPDALFYTEADKLKSERIVIKVVFE